MAAYPLVAAHIELSVLSIFTIFNNSWHFFGYFFLAASIWLI